MNSRQTRALAVAAALAAGILFTGAPALAQPPAQGPPAARPDAHSILASFYTSAMDTVISKTVAQVNQKLSSLLKTAGASLTYSGDAYSPYMLATQYKDRPNEFYVNIPYNLAYRFSLLGASLTITQSTNIQVFCDGWQTGAGALKVQAALQPAYFDPDQFSIFAEALQIPSAIQGAVQSALEGVPWGTFPMPVGGQACGTLGDTTQAQGLGDNVLFDPPHHRVVTLPSPQISVRVLKVTRLELHDRSGAPIYEPVETPQLSLWAFYSHLVLELPPMVEGQSYVPEANPAIQTPVPGDNGELVLIASTIYPQQSEEDSTFAVYGKSSHFGNGTQVLTTPKTWSEPPVNGGKPLILTGNGYQVVLQVSVPTLAVYLPPITPVVPVLPVAPVGPPRL